VATVVTHHGPGFGSAATGAKSVRIQPLSMVFELPHTLSFEQHAGHLNPSLYIRHPADHRALPAPSVLPNAPQGFPPLRILHFPQ